MYFKDTNLTILIVIRYLLRYTYQIYNWWRHFLFLFQKNAVIAQNSSEYDKDCMVKLEKPVPIHVLITPDGKVVSTLLKSQPVTSQPEEVTEHEQTAEKSVSTNGNKQTPEPPTRCNERGGRKPGRAQTQEVVRQSQDLSLQCNICHKILSGKRLYKRHMNQCTGNYIYNCVLCQKGFVRKDSYREHMFKHEGKYYDCQRCEKKFVSLRGLKQHMEHHTGNYSYYCQVCQKGYTKSNRFQEHMLKHEVESYVSHVPANPHSKHPFEEADKAPHRETWL